MVKVVFVPLVIWSLASNQGSGARPNHDIGEGVQTWALQKNKKSESLIQANETQVGAQSSKGFDLRQTIENALLTYFKTTPTVLTEEDTGYSGSITIGMCERNNRMWNQQKFAVKKEDGRKWRDTIKKNIGGYELTDWAIFGNAIGGQHTATNGVEHDVVERAISPDAKEDDIAALESRFDPEAGLIFDPINRREFKLGCAVTTIDPKTQFVGIAMKDFELCLTLGFDNVDMSSIGSLVATKTAEKTLGFVGVLAGKVLGAAVSAGFQVQKLAAWATNGQVPKLLMFDGTLRVRIKIPKVRLGLQKTGTCEDIEGFLNDDDVANMNSDVLEWKPGKRNLPFDVVSMGDATMMMAAWLATLKLPQSQKSEKSAWSKKQQTDLDATDKNDMEVFDYILDTLGVFPMIADKMAKVITRKSGEKLGKFFRSSVVKMSTHAASYQRFFKAFSWVSSMGQGTCGVDSQVAHEITDADLGPDEPDHQPSQGMMSTVKGYLGYPK